MNPETWAWPGVILVLGLAFIVFMTSMGIFDSYTKNRKQRISDAQAEDIRQLVQRYEQLAEKTLDAQQRAAVDVAELRVRLASIEQILRTVE
jgi:flagellar motor switch protein FliM